MQEFESIRKEIGETKYQAIENYLSERPELFLDDIYYKESEWNKFEEWYTKESSETYRYRITSTGGNSIKYGNCEICGKPATEIFHQVEERSYKNSFEEVIHFTQNKCTNYFGHKECLESKQR